MRGKHTKRDRFARFEVQADLYFGHPKPWFRAGDVVTFDLTRWPREGEPVLCRAQDGEKHLAVFRTAPFSSRPMLFMDGEAPAPVGLAGDELVIEGTLCRHVRHGVSNPELLDRLDSIERRPRTRRGERDLVRSARQFRREGMGGAA